MRVAGCVAVGLGERKRDTQIGSSSPGAVQIDAAAERLYSVLDAEQPGAAGEFGTSPPLSAILRRNAPWAPSRSTVTVIAEAPECLAALVNASATM